MAEHLELLLAASRDTQLKCLKVRLLLLAILYASPLVIATKSLNQILEKAIHHRNDVPPLQ